MERLYLFIFTLIFSVAAKADVAVDWSDFADQFAKKWQFECKINSPNSNIRSAYRMHALLAIQEGLMDLERVNPNLFLAVVRRTSGRVLRWQCDDSDQSVGAAFYNDLNEHIKLKPEGIALLRQSFHQRRISRLLQSSLLHEFYHFAGLDNFSIPAHNSFQSFQRNDTFTRDVVYACTAQTFSNSTQFVVDVQSDGSAFFNTQRVCNVCATAVIDGSGASLTGDQLNNSVACLGVDETLHYAGYWEERFDGKWERLIERGRTPPLLPNQF